ncbi:glycosyl hydrolase family 95 catalytic domain-containing protein [Paenibacillus aestuarii]|uniref:Glycoside hydrolase N-terminal domain-containing protein n=1 Tax=Paenibacillus aestuarii TaxID=516965 RepID=A0ABW0KHI3_9BACL|nr:glycoside hydrolase N-terminal domain-containing protein [Paenibacillus aestuarii]
MRTVTYDNAPSSWNEALPIGNGHFGGMVFFEEQQLTLALNHYEVYYQKLHRYSKAYQHGGGRDYTRQYGMSFQELKQRAKDLYRNPAEAPIYLYGDALSTSSMHRKYGKPSGGASHYPTGEIILHPGGALTEPDDYSLSLNIEQGAVDLRMEKGEDRLSVRTLIATEADYAIMEIKQAKAGLLQAVSLSVPARRYAETTVTYHQLDATTFYYEGSFYPDGENKAQYGPFTFLVMIKLIGAQGFVEHSAGALRIQLDGAGEEITLMATVVTEMEMERQELLSAALQRMSQAVTRVDAMKAEHQRHWACFFARSSVTIPDKMLEDLWYINLYALACSSGKGGRMAEQSCGLNGLWDIRQPTKWGSMWYWDVNIQAAFWPLYTANHLEIAEAFNDGLLAYVQEAERMADQYYGLDGVAADYPHALYVSIWPWCAQFLWDYYRYSMDHEFLREKAYPVFKRIARFVEGYLRYDAEKGQYDVFPDISPEQGPLTRNSTCSLAAIRYLLRIAARSNELLGEADEDRQRWQEIAAQLASYRVAASPRYGEVLLDSEWAPPGLHLRHPSLLMPIYPIGEIGKWSEAVWKQRAERTLRYAENHTEYGVFQFGWLSCAASRLGDGDMALRLLYEQGIDLSLRSNGLFAEETERWMNYCNITNEPLYHPHMMEASGEIVAAVNEMLLQSYSGVIEVFPAVPTGEPELQRSAGLYEHEVARKVRVYPGWRDCSFRQLLAVGGFEVSAEMKDGQVRWVRIRSMAGGTVRLRHPFSADRVEAVAVWRVDGVEEETGHEALDRRKDEAGLEVGGTHGTIVMAEAESTDESRRSVEGGGVDGTIEAAEVRSADAYRELVKGLGTAGIGCISAGEVLHGVLQTVFYEDDGQVLSFESVKGGEYVICPHPEADSSWPDGWNLEPEKPDTSHSYPRVHEAHTCRRVFLGKNRDTYHYKMLDHFTFDYYAGNTRESRLAAYRLDFGVQEQLQSKNYDKALPRQVHVDGILGQAFRPVTTTNVFTAYTGLGWERGDGLFAADRGGPDELRRDFVGGAEEAVLIVELPKGRYDLLLVTGDSDEPSYTEVDIPGQSAWKPDQPLQAGEFATELLPIAQRKDGYVQIRFRTREGLQWRINVLIINKNYPYL